LFTGRLPSSAVAQPLLRNPTMGSHVTTPYFKTIVIYGHTDTNLKQFSVQDQMAQGNYNSVRIMKQIITKCKIL
jgi:hypothetical protein